MTTTVFSERLKLSDLRTAIGVVHLEAVNARGLESVLASHISRFSVSGGRDAALANRRIRAFEDFFSKHGYVCPLSGQFEMVSKKGFPGGSPLVQALLLAELNTGLLMGAQDRGPMEGNLIYDLANEGEAFVGMRGNINCRANELVLRDDRAIIASVFQGPDQRTRLNKRTGDIVFFIFAAPGVELNDIRDGLNVVRDLFSEVSRHMSAYTYDRDGSAVPL